MKIVVQIVSSITTNTLGKDLEAKRLFVGGVNTMVEKLQPTAIVVCGKCPDWLQKKFPDIQIVQIPNYSKQWHEREKNKVTDKNAMEAATFYIEWGMYVKFLPEKASDLFVDFKFLVEVKGISSTKPNKIANRINEAFEQIEAELARYPEDKPKPPGKVVILSRHASFEVGFHAFCEGYKEAKRKGFIRGEVEFWFNGEIHTFKEED